MRRDILGTELHLDIKKQKYDQLNVIITGRVGDENSNVADVYIQNDGTPYLLTGKDIFYECLKADKKTVRDSEGVEIVDAEEGHFRYTFPTEVFSYPGNIGRSFFAIEKDGDFRATTQNFPVVSLSNALDGNVPSSHYIPDLEKLINQANELIEHIKELEEKAAGIVDEELQIVRDHVNKMMEEIETSVEESKEAIEKNIKELELLVQGLDGKLIQLAKDIEAMIEAVKNGGALKLDGSTAMTGTINSTAQTPFQFRDKDGVWHRQTIDGSYWFQTRDPLVFSGISTFEGPGVNFKHKFLRLKDKDVLVDGDIEEYFGLWSLTEQSLQHNGEEVISIDEKGVKINSDLDTTGNLFIQGKQQAPTNAAVWYSAEHTKYGSGESVITQSPAPRWAAGRTVDMSPDGTYKIREDGIYDIQAFLRIGAAGQDTQHILSIKILNSTGQLIEEHELTVDFVKIAIGHNRFHGALRWGFKKGEQFQFAYRHNSQQEVERQNSRLSITRLTHGLEEEN